MNAELILKCIEYLEPTPFEIFCRNLGPDEPEDRIEWGILYLELESLEEEEFIEIDRDSKGKIESLILTEEGAERIGKVL